MTHRIALLSILVAAGCTPSDEPAAIRLVDVFEEGMVEGREAPPATLPRTEWRFDETERAFSAV
ncbi:MAG TPA: hypothetical protein VJ921_09570, partial [Vicinamibacteria bacterium]|nr:hypothetical protein [Vicinamibacteria bacterium]